MKRTIVFFAALATLAGCVRTTSDTVINEDGTWTRTLKLTIAKEDMSGKPPKFEDTFILPTGEGWKTTRIIEKDNQILTAVRSAKLDETIARDIQVKEKDKVVCSNEVSVKQIAPGRFEYREVIKYVGDKKPDMAGPRAEMIPILKASLPAGMATDAEIGTMADRFFVQLWHIIFGPSDPILSQMIFSPDMAARRLKMRFGKAMDQVLIEQFGDKMDKDARLKTVRAVVAKLDAQSLLDDKKTKAQESSGPSDSNMVSMFASVRLPGRIVESNGELDELSGEVCWSFYPESAQVGDVVLRAVCEVK